MNPITRRQSMMLAAAAASLSPGQSKAAPGRVPSYRKGYDKQDAQDLGAAATEWFRNARFGLFLHYGLYSLLERHEWVQLREKIRVAEYAKLKDRFTAEKFNAGKIADLAVDAGMKYI